ncbi:hypothetical protein B5E84_17285 [Lachnoclostridium sp. An14]|uniref:relaxase/mobilization nuclease domain-containing protein n=1 Tax=Lachnoclostridium sp. An14 TaxID=1965562 RepID=UPI000B37DC92|nr:relaxase/mobilization nuclease domain-containing protein [Lachnoclostridium sp. An14]OUQ13517.1 hypothetical protein B5E84_17285 [Lachnoclostridium sp. An14]
MSKSQKNILEKNGILVNRARKSSYCQEGDIGRVVRYVIRQREFEDRADELISWGACGLPEWEDADVIVETFRVPQRQYRRKGAFGRFLDHEVYDFSPFEQTEMESRNLEVDGIGRAMARNIYREGFQVLYAVHRKADSGDLHIHFVINTVNFKTGKKRHENKTAVSERRKAFHEIVNEEIRKAQSKKRILEKAFS